MRCNVRRGLLGIFSFRVENITAESQPHSVKDRRGACVCLFLSGAP